VAFDFPASPSEGQIFNAPGGPSYVFNTPVWKAVGQGQIAIISDTPPTSPANGALWYESDSGVLFIWVNDGNSSQWVQVGGIMQPPAVQASGVFKISSGTNATAVAAIDITLPTSGYNSFEISIANLGTVSTAAILAQFSLDGTTFISGASAYHYAYDQIGANLTAADWKAASSVGSSVISLIPVVTGSGAAKAFLKISVPLIAAGDYQSLISFATHNDGAYRFTRAMGRLTSTPGPAAILRITLGAGNFQAGAAWQLNGVR
jgi:hypothetical protein